MQTALCSKTWHSFPAGQIRGLSQGLLHLPLSHARFDGHSLWLLHSTWRSGQVRTPCWFTTRLYLHLHMGLWLETVHFLFRSQEVLPQGSKHLPFWRLHAVPKEQSLSLRQPDGSMTWGLMGRVLQEGSGRHLTCGLPMWHWGHSHLGLWITTVHIAFSPQAALRLQGSTHLPLTHAWLAGQSKSARHLPSEVQRKVLLLQKEMKYNLPFSAVHSTSAALFGQFVLLYSEGTYLLFVLSLNCHFTWK